MTQKQKEILKDIHKDVKDVQKLVDGMIKCLEKYNKDIKTLENVIK